MLYFDINLHGKLIPNTQLSLLNFSLSINVTISWKLNKICVVLQTKGMVDSYMCDAVTPLMQLHTKLGIVALNSINFLFWVKIHLNMSSSLSCCCCYCSSPSWATKIKRNHQIHCFTIPTVMNIKSTKFTPQQQKKRRKDGNCTIWLDLQLLKPITSYSLAK